MAGKIVVGVDGSDSSAAALRWALAEAAARGATLQVVHAWQVPVVDGAVLGSFAFDVTELEASAHRLVDDMIAEATPDGPPVSIERTVVAGGPAQGLLDAAKAADVVVVGRRGLGGFGRMLLGSVSDRVVRHADTTVVVVPKDRADG